MLYLFYEVHPSPTWKVCSAIIKIFKTYCLSIYRNKRKHWWRLQYVLSYIDINDKLAQEKLEDTKSVFRYHIYKDRQYNGHMKKDKKTNNDWHPPSSPCFGTDIVYYIYLLLRFTFPKYASNFVSNYGSPPSGICDLCRFFVILFTLWFIVPKLF